MAFTDYYVSVAGDGNHDGTAEAHAWTLAEAIAANPAAGSRINVKAGTYANTTTTRTFDDVGSTTAPIWWRGYHTTKGDLDDGTHARVAGTDMPEITFTTGYVNITGAHQIFSNLHVSGAATAGNGQIYLNAGNITLLRCRSINTAANTAGYAVHAANTSPNYIIGCYFESNAAANRVVSLTITSYLHGCSVRGGIVGIFISSRSSALFNTVHNPATTGISTSVEGVVFGNSIYGAGTDGIKVTTVAATGCYIANNIIANSGALGINQSTGADTNITRIFNNDFYSNATNPIDGFTEQADDLTGDLNIALFHKSETASPWTDVTDSTYNFSLAGTAVARNGGYPGAFENESYKGYLDCGAVQAELAECINITMGDNAGILVIQEA